MWKPLPAEQAAVLKEIMWLDRLYASLGEPVCTIPLRWNMPFEKPTDAELENRYCYHAPKGDQAERYAQVRAAVLAAAKLIRDLTPCSPEQTRAFNALDEAMFLANAAIARRE